MGRCSGRAGGELPQGTEEREIPFKTLEWVDWFNTRRLLEPIGYIPPVEFEEAYYLVQ